jgi:hypothetical protein
MKRLDPVILKVFLYGLPLVIFCGVFAASYGWQSAAAAGGLVQALYNLSGLVFGVWLLLAACLLARLLVSGEFRERVLSKITFIRERDEREAMLTGKAAKTTMLTTLAVLLVLFFLSCIRVSLSDLPPEQAVGGKTKAVTIGAAFSLTGQTGPAQPEAEKTIVSYSGLPLSGPALIAGLIIWQVAAYNYTMKRLLK